MASLSQFWLTGKGLDQAAHQSSGEARIFKVNPDPIQDEDELKAYTLVAVLNAVSRVVDIVHGRNKLKVDFASKTAMKDLSQNHITLSAEPIMQPPNGFSLADSVDVLTGMALHEAAHSQFSSTEFYTEVPGNAFAGAIRNLVEDLYVEKLTTLLYPGYGGYFLKFRYYIHDLGKKHPPEVQGENNFDRELNRRVIDLILMLRSTTSYQSDIPRVRKAAEMIQRGLAAKKFEHLIKINPRSLAIRVYTELLGNIIQHDVAYAKPVNFIEKYSQNNQQQGSRHEENQGPTSISENMQQMVQNLRQEEVEVANMGEISAHTSADPDVPPPTMVIFRKPVITAEATAKYHKAREEITSHVIRLRNKLNWANTRQVIHQYGLPSGELDANALYQAPFSNKIFSRSQTIETRTRNLDIALLVDCSTSMTSKLSNGLSRLDLALNLTVLFIEAMEPVHSVNSWVYGFSQNVLADIAELYSPNCNQKNRLGTIRADGTTPEGSALKHCATRLISQGRIGVAKVLIVLADGNPDPGREKKMVKEQARRLQNMGCKLIHIAISEQVNPYGYQHSIPWTDYYTVTQQFGKLLRSILE